MENADKFIQNVQLASSAYKKWLPKLVQQFDDIPYSDGLKIQRFKSIVQREIAQYKECEQEGQLSKLKEEKDDVQLAVRAILFFSSGQMLKILTAVLEEIEFWEQHKEEIDAHLVLQTIRKLLTEEQEP